MKLLALDCDGVINSGAYEHEYIAQNGPQEDRIDLIDPVAVARLNKVIARTGAGIVVTSSWRIGRSYEDLITTLSAGGIVAEFVGVTPRLHRGPDGVALYRGDEILQFINGLPSPPESIAIIDDGSDMGPLMEYLVQTDWDLGISNVDVDRLVEMLNRPFRPI